MSQEEEEKTEVNSNKIVRKLFEPKTASIPMTMTPAGEQMFKTAERMFAQQYKEEMKKQLQSLNWSWTLPAPTPPPPYSPPYYSFQEWMDQQWKDHEGQNHPMRDLPPPHPPRTTRVRIDPNLGTRAGFNDENGKPLTLIWEQEMVHRRPGRVTAVTYDGKAREATPVEIILLSRDPMVQVTSEQYREAHNAIVEEARQLFKQVQGAADLYLDEEVFRVMREKEEEQALAVARGSNIRDEDALEFLPYPGRIHSRSEPVGPDEWVMQLWNNGAFSARGKTGMPAPSITPPAGEPKPKSIAAKKRKKETPAMPLEIAPGEEGFALLGTEAHAVYNTLGWGNIWNMRDKRDAFTSSVVGGLITNAAGSYKMEGGMEMYPMVLFTPTVFELKPQGARARKVNVDCWVLVYMTWDPDLQLMLLSLPDGSDLEYIKVPHSVLKMDDFYKSFSGAVWLALGNALLSDEDRDHVKNSGTGMTRLMERYWEKQAKIQTLKGLVAASMAANVHQDQARGMERVR